MATSLIEKGVDVDVIPWSTVGLVVMKAPGSVTLGATAEYLAGHYILQVSFHTHIRIQVKQVRVVLYFSVIVMP